MPAALHRSAVNQKAYNAALSMDHEHYKNVLVQAGVVFEPGLSQVEIQQVEEKYRFRFPPDLREFLMFAQPASNGFINWREANEDTIVKSLLWPSDNGAFDYRSRNDESNHKL
jgi:hypothetical protein